MAARHLRRCVGTQSSALANGKAKQEYEVGSVRSTQETLHASQWQDLPLVLPKVRALVPHDARACLNKHQTQDNRQVWSPCATRMNLVDSGCNLEQWDGRRRHPELLDFGASQEACPDKVLWRHIQDAVAQRHPILTHAALCACDLISIQVGTFKRRLQQWLGVIGVCAGHTVPVWRGLTGSTWRRLGKPANGSPAALLSRALTRPPKAEMQMSSACSGLGCGRLPQRPPPLLPLPLALAAWGVSCGLGVGIGRRPLPLPRLTWFAHRPRPACPKHPTSHL